MFRLSARGARRDRLAVLILLLIAGLWLRAAGSAWGFPLLANADEPLVTADAARLAFTGGWEPHVYDHPGHASIYLHSLLYRGAAFVASPGGHDGMAFYHEHILGFQQLSRLLTALWSTALIVVAFLIGREFSERQAFWAAGLVTFFPSFVQHACYITADIPLTLFLALNALFCIRYLKTGRRRHLGWAIAAAALALAEKYPGALATLTIGACILGNPRLSPAEKRTTVVYAAALYLIAAFAAAPYLFLRFDRVLAAVAIEAKPVHLGADGLDAWGNLGFYFTQYARRAGVPLVIATGLGFLLLGRRGARAAWPLYGGLVYLAFISSLGLHWERWALPCFFFFLQAAACGVAWGLEAIRGRHPAVRGVVVATLATTCLSLLLQSVYMTASFRLPDTRVAALEFCRQRGLTPENTAYESYTPFCPVLSTVRVGGARGPRDLLFSGKRYAVISSYEWGRFMAEPRRYPAQTASYRVLRSKRLVGIFDSVAIVGINHYELPPFPSQAVGELAARLWQLTRGGACSGPVIEIYDLGAPAKSPPRAAAVPRSRRSHR